MKYLPSIIKAIIGGLGLRFGCYWPNDYTGCDQFIILALSILVLLSGLTELNNKINS